MHSLVYFLAHDSLENDPLTIKFGLISYDGLLYGLDVELNGWKGDVNDCMEGKDLTYVVDGLMGECKGLIEGVWDSFH